MTRIFQIYGKSFTDPGTKVFQAGDDNDLVILYLIFTHESSYCFQCVLAIAILFVCLYVCHTNRSVKNGAS